MALTLTEGNKYSITSLEAQIIDRLTKDSLVLQKLPFREILGNSLTYDTIVTRSGADFYSVGDTWSEDTPTSTQDTVTLKILGGDADVDEFIVQTRSNILDVKAEALMDKAKAVQEKYLDTFYYGSTSGNAKSFKGLHGFMTSTTYNTVHASSSAGSDLSIKKVREAMDLISGFQPDVILMSKTLRRHMATYLDSVGSAFPTDRGQYGKTIEYFNGVQIAVDDHIVNTETTSTAGVYSSQTGSDTTSIFVVTFDPQGACGVQKSPGIQVKDLGDLETKDATRTRIKWYCGLMYQNLKSCAKVDGIHAAGTVVA